MNGDAQVYVGGNVGSDPDVKFTPKGDCVASFSVAATPRIQDANGEWTDGDTTWYRVTAWKRDAEALADNLRKGDRVIVAGRLRMRNYTDKNGQERVSLDITADRFGVGIVPKAAKPVGGRAEDDPWTS